MTIFPTCSSSPKPRPPRFAPPMSRAANSRPRSNCAGCSPASPTTPKHGSEPGQSPAGRHCRPRCPRRHSGPANGDPDPSPPGPADVGGDARQPDPDRQFTEGCGDLDCVTDGKSAIAVQDVEI